MHWECVTESEIASCAKGGQLPITRSECEMMDPEISLQRTFVKLDRLKAGLAEWKVRVV